MKKPLASLDGTKNTNRSPKSTLNKSALPSKSVPPTSVTSAGASRKLIGGLVASKSDLAASPTGANFIRDSSLDLPSVVNSSLRKKSVRVTNNRLRCAILPKTIRDLFEYHVDCIDP